MKLPLFIARRYLFARKSHHVINLISLISALGIAVGTAALVIVLSVYNGFGEVVRGIYRNYDADIRIDPARGKRFAYTPQTDSVWSALAADPRVEAVCQVLEDQAFLSYGGSRSAAVIKGVDETYEAGTSLAGYLVEGDFDLQFGSVPQAVVGRGIARELGISTRFLDPLEVYYPDPDRPVSLLDPMSSLRKETFFVQGIVALELNFDQTYVFAPIGSVRRLLAAGPDEVSSLEIRLRNPDQAEEVIAGYRELLGPGYRLLDRYRQNETVYRMMTYEKAVIYLIFFFIILVVSCNVFGSLAMLILEKRDDIATLRALGARDTVVRRIFVWEGVLISWTGMAAGMAAGILLCLAQQRFGLIAMPGNFVVRNYPVLLQFSDLVAVAAGVTFISLLLTAVPVYSRRIFSA